MSEWSKSKSCLGWELGPKVSCLIDIVYLRPTLGRGAVLKFYQPTSCWFKTNINRSPPRSKLRAWWEGGCCSLENVEHLKNSFQDRSGLSTPQESRTAASPSKPDKHYHCYATFIDSFPGIRRHLPRHSIKAPPLCKHLLLLLLDARLGFLS